MHNSAIQSDRRKISHRNLRGINLEEFSADLHSQLDTLSNNVDFPTQYEHFSRITNETLDRHAPLKTKISNKNNVPWQDSEYRRERALRRKREREWKKTSSENSMKHTLLCIHTQTHVYTHTHTHTHTI